MVRVRSVRPTRNDDEVDGDMSGLDDRLGDELSDLRFGHSRLDDVGDPRVHGLDGRCGSLELFDLFRRLSLADLGDDHPGKNLFPLRENLA